MDAGLNETGGRKVDLGRPARIAGALAAASRPPHPLASSPPRAPHPTIRAWPNRQARDDTERSYSGRRLTQNRLKNFHLNCVPRHGQVRAIHRRTATVKPNGYRPLR